jgi:hypothetical protein
MNTTFKQPDAWPYVRDIPNRDRLGISFSGGGIRSAAFCLGAYQCLSWKKVFERASYVSGVSGGGYLAGALAVALAESDETTLKADPPVWGRGSAEERHLRNNLSYLAPGAKGRIWLGVNFALGLVINLVPIILGSFIVGRIIGVLIRLTGRTESPSLLDAPLTVGAGTLAGVLLLGALLVVAVRRTLESKSIHIGARYDRVYETIVAFCVIAAFIMLFLGVLIPLAIRGAVRLSGPSYGGYSTFSLILSRTVLASFLVALFLVVGAAALLLLRSGRAPRLRTVLAWCSGLGLLCVPFFIAAEDAAIRPWIWVSDSLVIVMACLVLALVVFGVDHKRYSMHQYYRERLSRAFVIRRASAHSTIRAEAIPYENPIRLSDIGAALESRRRKGHSIPSFVFCAAVTAGEGDVPRRSWAASFTFEPESSGSCGLGMAMPTKDLERSTMEGGADLTLPSVMAISGAAISPFMGRFSIPAFRMLMALFNLRLGVWLPNLSSSAGSNGRQSTARSREFGALYTLREGLGLAKRRSRHIHVSDGGHWENLGLVELMRRRCSHILVIDASASNRGALSDIARAAALARAELGAELHLDPRCTVPASETGLADRPVAVGSVRYPDGSVGQIYYARCCLWPGAPVDLQVFREVDKRFPQHPTTNQFLTGEQFEAYRALGWAVAADTLEAARLSATSIDAEDSPPIEPDGPVLIM